MSGSLADANVLLDIATRKRDGPESDEAGRATKRDGSNYGVGVSHNAPWPTFFVSSSALAVLEQCALARSAIC